MAIDFTYSPDALNDDGKTVLASALELVAEVPNADGSTTDVPIGMARTMNVNERRSIIYNFVIGNKDPSTARDLIPGPIEESTIQMNTIVFYKANLIGVVSTDTKNPPIPGTRYSASIRYNTRPFVIKEIWYNPTTGNVVYIQSYQGCLISDAQKTRSYDNTSDLRALEDVTIHFKTTSIVTGEGIDDPSLGNMFPA